MNTVFLDIDGVLNCMTTYYHPEAMIGRLRGIEDSKADLLARIVHETDSQIVLVSTWAMFLSDPSDRLTSCLNQKLKERSMCIKDVTNLHIDRGLAVRDYVNQHKIDNYVVIDDSIGYYTDYPDVLARLVRCVDAEGLTEELADKAIAMLNGQKEDLNDTSSCS